MAAGPPLDAAPPPQVGRGWKQEKIVDKLAPGA